MHDLRMIHTDLKPENILLVSPEYVKVPDYKVLFFFTHVVLNCFHLHKSWTRNLANVNLYWILDLILIMTFKVHCVTLL